MASIMGKSSSAPSWFKMRCERSGPSAMRRTAAFSMSDRGIGSSKFKKLKINFRGRPWRCARGTIGADLERMLLVDMRRGVSKVSASNDLDIV